MELDDDCLKALLSRVSLKDLISNANLKLVSRRFSDAVEFAVKLKATRHSLTLEVDECNCHGRHEFNGRGALNLAGVPVSASRLLEFEQSSVLASITGVAIADDRWPESESLPEFKERVIEILRKLQSVERAALCLPDRNAAAIAATGSHSFLSFELLLSAGATFLTKLTALEVKSCVVTPAFYRSIRNDFLQLAAIAGHMTELALPAELYAQTANAVHDLWARLTKLRVESSGVLSEPFRSCQDILRMICEGCPNLVAFSYSCTLPPGASPEYDYACSGGQVGCVHDFTPLLRLEKLRSLSLAFGSNLTQRRRCEVPLLERLDSLSITGWPKFSDYKQLFLVVDMAPNVRRLYVTELTAYSRYGIFHELSQRLSRGRLQRLESLSIDSFDPSLRSLRLVTTIGAPIALKRFKLERELISDPYEEEGCRFASRDEFMGIQDAIANACNVTQLRLRLKWHDSYLQLEQALVAMATGSIIWLVLDVDWHKHYKYELDSRLIKAILPDSCELSEWNVFEQNAFPDSVVIRGRKNNSNAGGAEESSHPDENDMLRYFWVRLQISGDAYGDDRCSYDFLRHGFGD